MQAVLFDLDGTLLACDVGEQIHTYLQHITAYAAQHMPALAATLPTDIMEAVRALIADEDPTRTVAEKYWAFYCGRRGVRREDIEPFFERFYATHYNMVGERYRPVPEMLEAVAICKRRGFRLCIATNCFYPLSAVEWRLRWAGLDPAQFDCITHYENMHCTKPSLQYFREAAAHLGVPETQCLMVGNDGADDMVAGQLGMRTFLLTNFLLHENGYAGERGNYQALLDFLQSPALA